jgi:MinD-like ATPase involved in chromosome partitioning or flagellar assembly
VLQGGDTGAPIVLSDPESSAANALAQVAHKVAEHFGAAAAR